MHEDFIHSIPIKPAVDFCKQGSDSGLSCPCCGSALKETSTAVVCPNTECIWVSGNALDILAALQGPDGVAYFSAIYRDLAWDEERMKKYVGLRNHIRKIRKFIVRSSRRKTIGNKNLVLAQCRLRQVFGHSVVTGLTSFLLTGDEMRQFINHLREFRKIPNLRINSQSYLVFPVFGDYHTPAGFLYGTPEGDLSYLPLIDSYMAGCCGLWSVRPGGIVNFKSNPQGVLRSPAGGQTFSMLTGDELGDINLRGKLPDILPSHTSVSTIAAFFHLTGGGKATLIRTIIKAIQDGSGAMDLIRQSRLDKPTRTVLLNALLEAGLKDQAFEVQKHYDDKSRYESRTGNIFVAGPTGYQMIRNSTEVQIKVSNFTLEIKEFIHCPDSGKSFSRAEVSYLSEKFMITLNEKQIERPREIEKAVQAAYKVDVGNESPVVFEPTLMAQMIPWFNVQRSEALFKRGVDLLGWAPDDSSFTAPGWVVDYAGVNESVIQSPHPDSPVFENFDFTAPLTRDSDAQPSAAVRIINMAVAMMARFYSGRYVRAIPVKRTEHAAAFLAELFRGLGQLEAVRVNFNERKHQYAMFRGFPFYGIGTSADSARNILNSAFVLADEGINLTEEVVNWNQARCAFQTVVRASAEWLIQSRGSDVTQVKSATYESELEQEGFRYIRDHLKMRAWPESSKGYVQLEKFLEGISKEGVKDWFSHKMLEQKVHIRRDKLDLEEDLRSLCAEFLKTKTHYVVDAISASWMLEHYFGEAPSMSVDIAV